MWLATIDVLHSVCPAVLWFFYYSCRHACGGDVTISLNKRRAWKAPETALTVERCSRVVYIRTQRKNKITDKSLTSAPRTPNGEKKMRSGPNQLRRGCTHSVAGDYATWDDGTSAAPLPAPNDVKGRSHGRRAKAVLPPIGTMARRNNDGRHLAS